MRQKHFLSVFLTFLTLMFFSYLQAWGETSTLTFTAACGGSGTADDNVAWTVTSDGTESTFDNTKGIHYGTGSAKVQYIRLSTNEITGTITQVVVNASTASGVSATASVTVGGAAFGGDAQSLSTTATDYTFTGSASGEIIVTITKPSNAAKALYCKSVAVTYSTSGSGSGEPVSCAVPTFSPAAGAVVSGTNVTITSATEGATIYYTTDGSNPTTSSATAQPIAINAVTTIKAIAVKDGLNNSTVATATYTVLLPKTIAQVIPTTTNETEEFLLNDVTVTYAYGSNVYVKDATGYLLIYSSISGATNGKILQGLQGKAKLYNGLPEVSTVTKAPTINEGLTVDPEELNAYPTDADLNKYVTLEDVTFASAATLSGSVTNIDGTFKGMTLIIRNTFKLNQSLESGISYRVVGIVQKYNTNYQLYPISFEEIIEEGAPEAPTFSVAGGTYTSVQSVELSCATEGAAVYYTTNGDTPDNTSTLYSSPIEVGENMTIKAIAIKDEKESSIASAIYVINLPENEEVRKTWNLSTDSYVSDPEPTADLIQWTATYVSMKNERTGTETAVNNYIPTAKTSTRFYSGNKLTITPNGKTITSIVFTATSDSYATALANSTWTNASAVAVGSTVTVTPTDGENAVSAVIGGTCGFTAVQVNYITDTRASAGLSWSTDAVELTLGEAFSAPILNNPNSITAGEISIESSNTSLATVSAGIVSLVENATGTATITASFAGNALYKATEVSYTIKVNKPLSHWASVYTSNVTLSTEGGTSASAAKVIFDETEGGYDAIKAGTGSVSGAVKITVPAQATTLHYHAYGWNGEAVTLDITAPTGVTVTPASQAIASNSGIKSNSPFTLAEGSTPQTDAYYAVSLSGNTEEIELTFTATGGKRFILFGVNQEGGIVPVLDRIEISGDLTNKSGYKAGDDLNMEGLTVNAIYTLNEVEQDPVDVTEDVEWSYDALVENQTEVTVTATYGEKHAQKTITGLEVASADPKIYVDKLSVNFGTVAPNASVDAQTITVTLTNVAAATATLGGTNPEAFRISKTTLVDGDQIEISVVSTATIGSYSAKLTISDNAETAEAKTLNLSLSVEDVETAVSTTSKWVAATDADLVDGAEVLITGVKDEVTYAMGQQNNNNRAAVAATVSEGVLTPGEGTMSFTLVAQDGGTFALRTSNGKYLYAASSGNNYMRTQDDIDENAKWKITATSASAEGSSNRHLMRFNGTSSLFSCYSSGQTAIALYVPAGPATYTITYDLNGGEGTISSQDVEEGQSVVLADKPAYAGYYFMGWQDESGNSYKAGKEIQVNADMTLTAQWEELGEYKRTVTAGNFGTICLANPVYEGCIENAEVYKVISFSSLSKDGLILELVDAMEAGKPYFFISKTTEIKFSYSTEHSAEASNENGLYGTIDGTTVDGEGYYVLQSNELRETTGGAINLSANRAYLKMAEVPLYGSASSQTPADSPRRRVIRVQQSANTATGCEDVQGNNLQAAKVIEDGHVYIIREGKTYNAQGQLIR